MLLLRTDKGYFPLHRVLSVHGERHESWDKLPAKPCYAYVMHPETGAPMKVRTDWDAIHDVLVPVVATS